ncbi:MAG: UDP-N-acetylmuramate:L-alanyl-gamma-D-glutamyl-meso-diaminopimelate ligase [Acidobacteria bacterium]|nr:UDP-N-acetylmuramate:L-alanyl-gamma-D-glutamyl-meso-diaminopimelate ligase [Acidobacteriota bacterium]
MKPLPPGAHIHLVGVAGTAMGSLAGLLQSSGYRVTGSDAEIYPPISTQLDELKISVQEGYRAANLDPAPDLVVIGNALSRGNEEVEAVLDRRLPYASMPETLRELFLQGRETLVVAGTHGKTTVTSLLSWIFHAAGRNPGFLIGGVPCNFPQSFAAGSGPHFILEGDEYDTAFFDKGPKFLHYRPDSVILTSIEFDHADIYQDLAAVETAFRRLINLIPRRGCLIAAAESETVGKCASRAFCSVETFGFDQGDWQAKDIGCTEQATTFRVVRHGESLGPITMRQFGRHNVANALCAAAMASRYGIEWEAIRRALASFQGVRRRMEVVGEADGVIIVDDFAHHPTAIRETLRAARSRFPGRRLWALLEPRSNTLRRSVFQDELVDALAGADRVLLAEVFRQDKIPPDERLNPEQLRDELRRLGIVAEFGGSADHMVESLAGQLRSGDVVVAMSNGGFGGIHRKLLDGLARQPAQSRKGR